MRKLIFQINVSLDGFADHTAAIADDELHDYFSAQLDTIDIELFGRVTYQLMESYWPHAHKDPHATGSTLRFADKFNTMPKIVFSNTLTKASWQNTQLIKDNIAEEVIKLKNQPGKYLSLGGISIIQQFMKLGLVDEFWLLVHPVIVGKGRKLFDASDSKINLKLVDTMTFKSGVVVLHYLNIK